MEEVSKCCFWAMQIPTFKFCPICGKELPEHKEPSLFRVLTYRNGRLVNVEIFSGQLAQLLARCELTTCTYGIEKIDPLDLFTILPEIEFHDSVAKFSFLSKGMTYSQEREYIQRNLPGYEIYWENNHYYLARRR